VTFRHGEPLMIDYTPASGNVSAGQVLLLGNTAGLCCVIPHSDIANNVKGAVAAGGGVYDVVNLNNAANGAKVYWDDTNNKVTTTSTNNALFGFIVSEGGGGANTTAKALHQPYV
jgi:Uncharacterized conserved protein (DUF2190)